MKIWIVWLPNVGKSTLFNALTKNYAADAANFPFCTIEPNVGVVEVKDERVDKLAEISNTQKKIYAAIDFVDIAGLVKGASEWEWLWNKFLAHIREVDAIVQVVRLFADDDVVHVEGWPDPLRDIEIINTELILADIQSIENIQAGLQRKLKSNDPEVTKLVGVLDKIMSTLEQEKLAIDILPDLSEAELELLKPYNFLTFKPFVYALNVTETDLIQGDALQQQYEQKLHKKVAIVSAKFESELIELDEEEKELFMDDLKWWDESAVLPTLDDLIALAFDTVGLMYYFTTGEKETRARTVRKWSTAPQAAGVIHTDFEKWFIKADVVTYTDFVTHGWWSGSKDNGCQRLEGKEYIVQDGDVMLFKFNN